MSVKKRLYVLKKETHTRKKNRVRFLFFMLFPATPLATFPLREQVSTLIKSEERPGMVSGLDISEKT